MKPGLSLAHRLILIVMALLTVAATVTGIAIYEQVRRSMKEEVEERLDRRLVWLQSSLELEGEAIELSPKAGAVEVTKSWRIATLDNRELWSSQWSGPADEMYVRVRRVVLGDPDGTEVSGTALASASGDSGEYPRYKLPGRDRRVTLILRARESVAGMRSELRRLAVAIGTIGPLVLLIVGAALWVFLRWQLKPLSAIALQAAAIGPTNVFARIGDVGTSRECLLLRDALNRMIERLSEGLDRERRFASYAAHELRTPLAQLRTNIEVTLRKPRGVDGYTASLTDALTDVERMERLVQHLLQLTRCEEESIDRRQVIAVDDLVARVQRQQGRPLECDPAPSAVAVRGNDELLVSALGNVIENAHRHAAGDPPRVSIHADDARVRLTVSDHGPGVPAEQRERIFEPLARLDAVRSIGTDAGGFGLGLAVARAAVRACGGELVCRGRTDAQSGAEFVFDLLRAHTPPPPA